MTKADLIFTKDLTGDRERGFEQHRIPTAIDRILQKLSGMGTTG